MMALKYLAIAVAYRRVGVVVLDQGMLAHWQISTAPYDSADKMASFVIELTKSHRPNVIVTQKLDERCQKGPKAKQLIAVIGDTIAEGTALHVEAVREHDYKNKYEEAAMLVERHPDLAPWLPKRDKFYDNEPRSTVLFEALSLAENVMRGSSTSLAAALG